jgi:DNA-binding beta-propeller fold protein YncE
LLKYMSWIIVMGSAIAACGGGGGGPISPADAGGSGDGSAPGRDAGVDPGLDAGVPDAGPPDAGDTAPAPLTQGTSTVAGRAFPGYVDGARDAARFADPVNVLYRAGKLYVADFDNNKIRVIDTATFATTTLIDQPGFQRPFALAFAADGTLYISTDNDPSGAHSATSGSIWRVAPAATTATVVLAAIGRPRGLAVVPDGRLAATDYMHQVIWLIDVAVTPATKVLLAGAIDQTGMVDATGGDARFTAPYGVAACDDGTLIVADFDNHRIRQVTLAGVVTTLAGTGVPGFADGALGQAQFDRPQGVARAASGDLFITDINNYRVRRISGTAVQTVAGDGTPGFLDADDPLASQLFGLEGVSVVGDGSMLYVADGSRGEPVPYNRIRQVARHW